MAPLAPGSLIVVVGITGYIASHTGLQALKAGYRVRGTVRSMAKAEQLRAAYEKEGVDVSPEKLEFVTLDDLTSEAQFDAAFAGADGVIHPALPEMHEENLMDKILQSTLSPLRAATKAGIKRFVLSGTLGSVLTPGSPTVPTDHLITTDGWNDDLLQSFLNSTEEEKKSPSFYFYAYVAGKILGEREAWKYVETESPPFELTIVLPAMNWGPKLFGAPPMTLGWLDALLKGDESPMAMPPHYLVDVRDDAKLHVLALSEQRAVGKRLWGAAHPVGWNQVLAILRRHYPDKPIPSDRPASAIDPCPWRIENSLSTQMLGGQWIGVEECIVASAKSLGY
ncbi:NAD(P)-binding protein, partial [Calocera viscosa TUFC12733]